MNKIILMGNLTRDLETKQSGNGKTYLNFSVAINEGEKTTFVDCSAFDKTADIIAKFFGKGDKILLEGRLATSEYEKNGEKIKKTGVVVDKFEFVENKKKPSEVKVEEEALPFY